MREAIDVKDLMKKIQPSSSKHQKNAFKTARKYKRIEIVKYINQSCRMSKLFVIKSKKQIKWRSHNSIDKSIHNEPNIYF
jgi:hypothetical protein